MPPASASTPRTKSADWASSSDVSRSALLSTKKIRPTWSRAAPRNSISARLAGLSTESTKIAASASRSWSYATCVLWAWTDPMPGVSTRMTPRRRIAAG